MMYGLTVMSNKGTVPDTKPITALTPQVDKNLVQINVTSDELQQRIHNFIERKREQVNISNIHDFIPNRVENDLEESETCARVRTQFVRRNDSKGHLKVHKVHNEWGPQTVNTAVFHSGTDKQTDTDLPQSISERVVSIEKYLNIGPVSKDIYKRLKEMEDRIAYLESVSPEYALFWRTKRETDETSRDQLVNYTFSAEDIARKIEQLEKNAM